MSDLLHKVREKSDIYILNVLSQSHSFSPEILEAAKVVGRERGLEQGNTENLNRDMRRMKEYVFRKMMDGMEPEKAAAYLEGKKVARPLALNIMKNAYMKGKTTQPEKSQNKGYIIGAFIIVYFIIKMIIRNT